MYKKGRKSENSNLKNKLYALKCTSVRRLCKSTCTTTSWSFLAYLELFLTKSSLEIYTCQAVRMNNTTNYKTFLIKRENNVL